VVRLFLSRDDVALNLQDEYGMTALMWASSKGHEAVVGLLLSHNDIVLNIQDKDGWTALFAASTLGHYAVVKLLLSHHLDVAINAHARNGQTALIAASVKGHTAIVKLLRSHNDIRSGTSLGLLNVSCANTNSTASARPEVSPEDNLDGPTQGQSRVAGKRKRVTQPSTRHLLRTRHA